MKGISELGSIYNYGFDAHPFKVQWYNYLAETKYHLPYEKDTIAFTIIGRPDMFEKAFKTFVCNKTRKPLVDTDYKFIMFYMKKIQQVSF
ncbi:cyanocobalamin reductase / alkylcobalamin dealkylase-like [Octopus sinensis]|uniref:Cyanocobalamin reductase (cyanide-eliminating) n=1 Tax=Octopus sinensis TaxID=2607531 RepID=A0A7E6EZ59_9MOLL|nr:cyanocobalamin reductase / alkylcobalamin dealkylase-like [Octopus sinensis]